MGSKRKNVKKNKVVPCADANTHARERIANRKHKQEVLRKKIEDFMKQRRAQLEKEANGAKKPED